MVGVLIPVLGLNSIADRHRFTSESDIALVAGARICDRTDVARSTADTDLPGRPVPSRGFVDVVVHSIHFVSMLRPMPAPPVVGGGDAEADVYEDD